MQSPKLFFSSIINRLKRKRRHKPKAASMVSQIGKGRTVHTRIPNALKAGVIPIILIFLALTSYFVLWPLAKSIWEFELTRDPSDGAADVPAWDGKEKMNIVLIGLDKTDSDHAFVDNLQVFFVDPQQKNVGIFNINPDLVVYFPSLKTERAIRTVYNHPDVDSKEIRTIIEGVEQLLAIRMDRYLILEKASVAEVFVGLGDISVELRSDLDDEDLKANFDSDYSWEKGEQTLHGEEVLAFLEANDNGREDQLDRQLQVSKEIIRNLKIFNAPGDLSQLLNSLSQNSKTNFSKYELIRLAWNLKDIREDQIKIAYSKSNSMILEDSPGLYPQYKPIVDSIDNNLANVLINIDVLREQARIEVLNGSGVRGLASSRARWIKNSGGRVIYYGNSNTVEAQTKIYVPDKEKYPATLRELEKIFNGKITYLEQEYRFRHLGDIVVVIGEEYE